MVYRMYYAPSDLKTALDVVSQFNVRVIAGGTDFFPSLKPGQIPTEILDVTGIADLHNITQSTDGTRIGSAVTWSQIIECNLPSEFEGLKQAALEVGSIQIQNAGTLVGNVCNASPAADGVPPLLILNAVVEVASRARGLRKIPLSEFLLGVRETALKTDELVTAITIPPATSNMGAAFEKLGSRKFLVISITMTAAMISCDKLGRISEARIAVGACPPVALRLPQLEASLIGQLFSDVYVNPDCFKMLAPIDDVRGSKEFRLEVLPKQCERVISKAINYG